MQPQWHELFLHVGNVVTGFMHQQFFRDLVKGDLIPRQTGLTGDFRLDGLGQIELADFLAKHFHRPFPRGAVRFHGGFPGFHQLPDFQQLIIEFGYRQWGR